MDKNIVRFGILAILVFVAVSILQLWPPQETLKPGLDLAGGTSLIYEIDSTGLEPGEIKNLAQRIIPILLKRIDPGNVQNIVMRPQGDTRLEIQVPLSSVDTLKKRQALDDALGVLEEDNINLAVIRRTLSKAPAERTADFEQFSRDSSKRQEILATLAETYDARKAMQVVRDEHADQIEEVKQTLSDAGIDTSKLENIAILWPSFDVNEQNEAIETALILPSDEKPAKSLDEKKKRQLISDFIEVRGKWAQAVNSLADAEVGLNLKYKQAESALRDFNLSTTALGDILNMPGKSSKRKELLENLKTTFPARVEEIDHLVTVFEEYRPVRGRIDGPEDVKRMLKGAGVLEFRILPTAEDGKTNKDEMLVYLETLKTKGPKQSSDSKYIWLEIENIEEWQRSDAVVGMFAEKYYVLASNQKNESMHKASSERLWKLKKAYPAQDDVGRRAIGFTHDEIAADLFYKLTKQNIQRPLCIILDGVAISAPNISTAIRSRGIITGTFGQLEQRDMVDKLNAGSLPARLIEPPVSEKTIGASIGADNRDKGIKAAIIGLAAIAVFMLFYYAKAGSIADMALFMNILFILAIMALSRATFTLPGIAGIILTIGMSVDANVLIFERIREEQLRGSSLRLAIASGYQRALRTILDANITTFITAMILYMAASEEIKGFAITLMLGIVSSMFTALFATRVIFQLLLDKGIIKDHLFMMRLIKKPNINWMSFRGVFVTISVLLIAGGLFVFFTRDDIENNKYDIEFTGGTSVQINLKPGEELDRSQVEKIIRDKGDDLENSGIAAAKVYSVGDEETMRQYEITTIETNKTTAEITFSQQGSQTLQTVTEAIEKAQSGSITKLDNLVITGDTQNSAKFIVATSQINKSVVNQILTEAFGSDVDISEAIVDEIVNRAVREAFEGKLLVQENLKPKIISTDKIDDSVIETFPELSDFLSGVKIKVSISTPVTISQIEKRFNDLRFKPDMEDLLWHKYQILPADMAIGAEDKPLSEFIYVSIEPGAGYRELSEEQWSRYIDNEHKKILAAATLQSSLPRVTQIAPSIGEQAKARAIVAIVLSLIAIITYIWIRFGTARYGVAAIVALVHDVCITLGVVVGCTYLAGTPLGDKLLIGDFKINLAMIAAFLTIIGYSLNDTIVVFDRIRENRGRLASLSPQIISDSINQTLSRTLLTSFTTFLVVLIMYIWGGSGLRGFTFAMLIGIIVGTYSSVAIAAPILLLGTKKQKK